MYETIYSVPLFGAPGSDLTIKADSSGYSSFPLTLGQGYADTFRRDRAPSQLELLGNLVGTAYRCATLNAHLVANARLRLYARKYKTSGKVKGAYFDAARSMGGTVTKRVPSQRIRALRDLGACGKSALLDAVEQGEGDIEEVTDHPILDLLRNPEDAQTDGGLTPYSHRYVTQMLLETLGKAYWFIEALGIKREGGKAQMKRALRLLMSQRVVEKVDETGKRYIDHYEYGTNHLDPKDVVRITYPDPSNPHLGFLSPMRAAAEKIRLMRGGDAFLGALLQNGGYPAGILSPKDGEGVISDKEAKRIESSWRSQSGMNNAGRIMVMGSSAVQLQTLAFKPAEIIDVNRSRELQGEIADCFDVPRTKLFRDDSNRASSESGDAAHAKDAGLPRCSMLEEALNVQLVSLFDDTGTLFLAFDSPVPADRTLALEETRTGGQLGLASIDEGRAALGLDPMEGEIGDIRIIPKGSVLLKPDGTTIQTDPEPDNDDGDTPPKKPAKKPKKSKTSREIRQLVKVVGMMVEGMAKGANGSSDVLRGSMLQAGLQPAQNSQSHRHELALQAGQGRIVLPCEPPGSELLRDVRPDPDDGSEVPGQHKQGRPQVADVKSRLAAAGYSAEEIAEKLTKPTNGQHVSL